MKAKKKKIKDPFAFKFRAETIPDVWKVMFRLMELTDFEPRTVPQCHDHEMCVTNMVMTTNLEWGSVEVTARIARWNRNGTKGYLVAVPLETVRKVMGEMVDCHVISQSVDYAERYTGERYSPDYGSGHLDVKSYRHREVGQKQEAQQHEEKSAPVNKLT